jgi:glycosyltransferase involved in cell wall biosynthesis
MKKIGHVLIAYGNKNQNYTTQLLRDLSNFSSNYHFVYCHAKLKKNDGLDVFQSKSLTLFKSFLLLFKLHLKDQKFKQLYNQLGYKNLYKWLLFIDQDPEVIHIHHLHVVPQEILIYFRSKGKRLIASVRGRDLLINTNDKIKSDQLFKKLELVNAVHTISDFMSYSLKTKFGLKSEIIYRGIQMPLGENVKKTNHTQDTINAIAVGRLVWEKGHIYLIDSVSRLLAKGYAIYLDIYGDGPLMEFLNFRINQLGLTNYITLKGYVKNEKLKPLYKNYNLAVQPSLSEALSNGLIDFMIHNLPCVVSDAGGMKEVIVHKKNGLVFNILNPIEMDDFILEAVNIDFTGLIAFNNHHKAKFDIKNEISELEELYMRND